MAEINLPVECAVGLLVSRLMEPWVALPSIRSKLDSLTKENAGESAKVSSPEQWRHYYRGRG